MAQHYSDERRESEETALPDVETFEANYGECPDCGSVVFFDHFTAEDGRLMGRCRECRDDDEDRTTDATELNKSGWWFWFCFPGCLPDSEPEGPYQTEAEALNAARELNGDW